MVRVSGEVAGYFEQGNWLSVSYNVSKDFHGISQSIRQSVS